MGRYQINPMTSHETGAEIRGLDLTDPIDDDLKRQINADFAKYHVLAFRDQKLTPPQFAAAGEIFGPLLSQHHKDNRALGHPEVYEIRNTEIAPGKYQIAGASYHTDHSNHPCPPRATALHTVQLPSRGGDTQYANMHDAYDDLPEAMKRRIDGLQTVHVWESKYSPRKLRKLAAESSKALPPPSIHPLVRTHPDNGRKFLYMNPVRIEGIIGMEESDAMALIRELIAHATQAKYEYRHKWLFGDMVVWDNRSVMHQANGDYDMKETRHLYRIMMQDDPALWTAEGEKTLTTATA
jgi:taurine dioxygenase